MTDLERRVDGLERENRRLKRWGAAVLLAAAGLALMGQAQGGEKKPKRIEAEEFALVCRDGKVCATLQDPGLVGGPRLRLGDRGSFYSELGPQGLTAAVVGEKPKSTWIDAFGVLVQTNLGSAFLQAGNLSLSAEDGLHSKKGRLDATSAGVTLNDEKGARAVLGVASLESSKTGATEQTSPGSLVLFGKDDKVMWRAP